MPVFPDISLANRAQLGRYFKPAWVVLIMKFLKDGNGFVMGCNGQQIHPLSQLFTLNQGSWLKDQHQPVSVSRVLCALEILYKEVPRENQGMPWFTASLQGLPVV